jgi:hypothetical protein
MRRHRHPDPLRNERYRCGLGAISWGLWRAAFFLRKRNPCLRGGLPLFALAAFFLRKCNPRLRGGLPLFAFAVRFPETAQPGLASNCRLPQIIVVLSLASLHARSALLQGKSSQAISLRDCSELRCLTEMDSQYKQWEPAAQARVALPQGNGQSS